MMDDEHAWMLDMCACSILQLIRTRIVNGIKQCVGIGILLALRGIA